MPKNLTYAIWIPRPSSPHAKKDETRRTLFGDISFAHGADFTQSYLGIPDSDYRWEVQVQTGMSFSSGSVVGEGEGGGAWSWCLCVEVGAVVFVARQSCSRVDSDKSVPDFVYHAGFVWCSSWLQVFKLTLGHEGGDWRCLRRGWEAVMDAAVLEGLFWPDSVCRS